MLDDAFGHPLVHSITHERTCILKMTVWIKCHDQLALCDHGQRVDGGGGLGEGKGT